MFIHIHSTKYIILERRKKRIHITYQCQYRHNKHLLYEHLYKYNFDLCTHTHTHLHVYTHYVNIISIINIYTTI